MRALMGREPALSMAVVQAVLALALAFGAPLTAEQVGAVLALSAAVLGWVTRSQVKPWPGDGDDDA